MDSIVAVVTGGTRGIGLGIAESLVRRGVSVAVTYHQNEPAAEHARSRLSGLSLNERQQVLFLKGDVGDPAMVARHYADLRAELGPATVLVNNAGIMPERTFDTISLQDWHDTLRINLSGAFYWSRLTVPDMKAARFGRIVNIASIAARGGGVVGPHYAASKAGLVGFTRYAARELGNCNITVNAIAPAFIEDAGIFAGWAEERKTALKEKTVVPPLGNVGDVVRAFDYLMDSPFVTGVTLDVNGGAFMI